MHFLLSQRNSDSEHWRYSDSATNTTDRSIRKCYRGQWLNWKLKSWGNCRLGVGPLFVVVDPAAVVTDPHGQWFFWYRTGPTVLQLRCGQRFGSVALTGVSKCKKMFSAGIVTVYNQLTFGLHTAPPLTVPLSTQNI